MNTKLTRKEEATYLRMGAHLGGAFSPDREPLDRLNDLMELRRELDSAVTGGIGHRLAEMARKKGATWEMIGRAMGVTKQMAWQRWSKKAA